MMDRRLPAGERRRVRVISAFRGAWGQEVRVGRELVAEPSPYSKGFVWLSCAQTGPLEEAATEGTILTYCARSGME
jgi:hypothetical protein